jgi:hypothetical protein
VINSPVDIAFKFPDDISQSLFPIPVRIYSKLLTPASDSGMSIEIADNDFYYVYNAAYNVDANNQQLPHTLSLVSTTTQTEETLTIAAERFNDASVSFTADELPIVFDFINPRFMRNNNNVWTTTNAKPRQVSRTNTDMRVYFSLHNDCELPVDVTFVAPYLTLRSGTSTGISNTGISGSNANTVITMRVNTTNEVYFTVRLSSTTGTDEQGAMYLQAEGFNTSANLNSN